MLHVYEFLKSNGILIRILVTLYSHRTPQNQILSVRRIKKKKIGKAKKIELDKDQNQNTSHLRKRLGKIL